MGFIKKSLLLLSCGISTLITKGQTTQDNKTYYLLKTSLINITEIPDSNNTQWVYLEKIDSNFNFSILRFTYLQDDCIVLRKKLVKSNLLTYKRFTEYVKASKTPIMTDKFYLVEPLGNRKYTAYRISDMLYMAKQDPMEVLENY
ncbi:hypothetical protein SAMN05444008_12731 [Cnuella takakiae]|uniref:Uncharacterized protein n=1 Tax=Cnuella takakiae TaxID=1302690 RepID=A0A1M5J3J1_9BACT|nr:hypothetical protein [Cnuella takakiae]SHG34925.1 hypothetical protein SAMN05444008_12731 [Cnuella takakiae]